MDSADREILQLLQDDADTPLAVIADAVSLSTTPCWRRIQKLRSAGVIRKNVAICDPHKLNVGVTVFVSIRTSQHNQAWLERFAKVVKEIPEVVQFYRMSGDVDYLLRVVVSDIAGYDAVYKKLIKAADLSDVSSSFAMQELKYTTALPLNHLE